MTRVHIAGDAYGHRLTGPKPRVIAVNRNGGRKTGARFFMTTFDEREQSFERKFKHDQELRFKTNARRNRLLGLWAAERIGLKGAEAEAYARTVVDADLGRPGGAGAREKVLKDLAAKGIVATDAEVQREQDRLLIVAKEQILKQAP
jgi:hypothetical protein